MQIVRLEIDPNNEMEGMDAIALVENPAIETDFVYFNKQEEFKTYNDYPKAAKENARIGIERNKEINNKCATQVGKVRAQQLVNGEALSVDTIKRMRAFLIRQKDNYDLAVKRKDYEACGYISYMLWGGPEALPWAEKTLRKEGIEFNVEERIIESIIELELKKLTQKPQTFKVVDEQQIIVSPVMIPDLMIPRYNELGEEYMVYFDAKTIKEMAYKYAKDKLLDKVNLEHDSEQFVEDIYLVESWIKEDENDKSNKYGFDLPVGTWFTMYKIDNKDVWENQIKAGKVKGVSLEGLFNHVVEA